MKSLKDFLIPPNRALERFQFSEYVIRLQIQRQIQAKRKNFHWKICKKTKSQSIKQLIGFFEITREELIIVILRKERKTYKMGGYAKSTNIL